MSERTDRLTRKVTVLLTEEQYRRLVADVNATNKWQRDNAYPFSVSGYIRAKILNHVFGRGIVGN